MPVALALGLLVGLAAATGVLLGAALVVALVRARRGLLPLLLSFAAGTLLGAALLGLIPEAAERLPLTTVTWIVLLAIVAFVLLEQWVLWRHSHDLGDAGVAGHGAGAAGDGGQAGRAENGRAAGQRAEASLNPAGYLILVGDGVHNLVDGLLLGAAFVAETQLGIVAAAAVLAHELPQEVGDFVLLLESGLSRTRALLYNLLSASTILPGVVLGYLLAERIEPLVGVALGAAAGGFLYVALADLVPELHRRRRGLRRTLQHQLVPLLTGVVLIWALGRLEV